MKSSQSNYEESKYANHLRAFQQIHEHEKYDQFQGSQSLGRAAVIAGITGRTATKVTVQNAVTNSNVVSLASSSALRAGMAMEMVQGQSASKREYAIIESVDSDSAITLDKSVSLPAGDVLEFFEVFRSKEVQSSVHLDVSATDADPQTFDYPDRYETAIFPGVELELYQKLGLKTKNVTVQSHDATANTFTVAEALGTDVYDAMRLRKTQFVEKNDAEILERAKYDPELVYTKRILPDLFSKGQNPTFFPDEDYAGVGRVYFSKFPKTNLQKTMPESVIENTQIEDSDQFLASLYAVSAEKKLYSTSFKYKGTLDSDIKVGSALFYDDNNSIVAINEANKTITVAEEMNVEPDEEIVFKRNAVKFMTYHSVQAGRIRLNIHGGSRWETLLNDSTLTDKAGKVFTLTWDSQKLHNGTMEFTLDPADIQPEFSVTGIKVLSVIDDSTLIVSGGDRLSRRMTMNADPSISILRKEPMGPNQLITLSDAKPTSVAVDSVLTFETREVLLGNTKLMEFKSIVGTLDVENDDSYRGYTELLLARLPKDNSTQNTERSHSEYSVGTHSGDVRSSSSLKKENEMYDFATGTYRQFPIRRRFHEGFMSQDICESAGHSVNVGDALYTTKALYVLQSAETGDEFDVSLNGSAPLTGTELEGIVDQIDGLTVNNNNTKVTYTKRVVGKDTVVSITLPTSNGWQNDTAQLASGSVSKDVTLTVNENNIISNIAWDGFLSGYPIADETTFTLIQGDSKSETVSVSRGAAVLRGQKRIVIKKDDNTFTLAGVRGNKDPNPQHPKMSVNSFHENDAAGIHRESLGERDVKKYTADATFLKGTNTITLATDASGVTAGMTVEGRGIPSDTFVLHVDDVGTGVTLSNNTFSVENDEELTFTRGESVGVKNMFELKDGSKIRDMTDGNNAKKVTITLHDGMWSDTASGITEQISVVVDEKVKYNLYDATEYKMYNQVEVGLGKGYGTRMGTCPRPGEKFVVRWGSPREVHMWKKLGSKSMWKPYVSKDVDDTTMDREFEEGGMEQEIPNYPIRTRTYQWYKGQRPITGATRRFYTVTEDDVAYSIGKRLWCRVSDHFNAYILNTIADDPGINTTHETGFFHTEAAITGGGSAVHKGLAIGYHDRAEVQADKGTVRSWEFPSTLLGQNVYDVPPILPVMVRNHQNGNDNYIYQPDATEGLTSLTGFEVGDVIRLSPKEYIFGRDEEGNHHYYEWSAIKTPISTLLQSHNIHDLHVFGKKTAADFYAAGELEKAWWKPFGGAYESRRHDGDRMSSELQVKVDIFNHYQDIDAGENANNWFLAASQRAILAGWTISSTAAQPVRCVVRATSDGTQLKLADIGGLNIDNLGAFKIKNTSTTITGVFENKADVQVTLSAPHSVSEGDIIEFVRTKDVRADLNAAGHADDGNNLTKEVSEWCTDYSRHSDVRVNDILYNVGGKTHNNFENAGVVLKSKVVGPVALIKSSVNHFPHDSCLDFTVMMSTGNLDPLLVNLYVNGNPDLRDSFMLPAPDGMTYPEYKVRHVHRVKVRGYNDGNSDNELAKVLGTSEEMTRTDSVSGSTWTYIAWQLKVIDADTLNEHTGHGTLHVTRDFAYEPYGILEYNSKGYLRLRTSDGNPVTGFTEKHYHLQDSSGNIKMQGVKIDEHGYLYTTMLEVERAWTTSALTFGIPYPSTEAFTPFHGEKIEYTNRRYSGIEYDLGVDTIHLVMKSERLKLPKGIYSPTRINFTEAEVTQQMIPEPGILVVDGQEITYETRFFSVELNTAHTAYVPNITLRGCKLRGLIQCKAMTPAYFKDRHGNSLRAFTSRRSNNLVDDSTIGVYALPSSVSNDSILRTGNPPLITLFEAGFSEDELKGSYDTANSVIKHHYLLEDRTTSFVERPVRDPYEDGIDAYLLKLVNLDFVAFMDAMLMFFRHIEKAIKKGFEKGKRDKRVLGQTLYVITTGREGGGLLAGIANELVYYKRIVPGVEVSSDENLFYDAKQITAVSHENGNTWNITVNEEWVSLGVGETVQWAATKSLALTSSNTGTVVSISGRDLVVEKTAGGNPSITTPHIVTLTDKSIVTSRWYRDVEFAHTFNVDSDTTELLAFLIIPGKISALSDAARVQTITEDRKTLAADVQDLREDNTNAFPIDSKGEAIQLYTYRYEEQKGNHGPSGKRYIVQERTEGSLTIYVPDDDRWFTENFPTGGNVKPYVYRELDDESNALSYDNGFRADFIGAFWQQDNYDQDDDMHTDESKHLLPTISVAANSEIRLAMGTMVYNRPSDDIDVRQLQTDWKYTKLTDEFGVLCIRDFDFEGEYTDTPLEFRDAHTDAFLGIYEPEDIIFGGMLMNHNSGDTNNDSGSDVVADIFMFQDWDRASAVENLYLTGPIFQEETVASKARLLGYYDVHGSSSLDVQQNEISKEKHTMRLAHNIGDEQNHVICPSPTIKGDFNYSHDEIIVESTKGFPERGKLFLMNFSSNTFNTIDSDHPNETILEYKGKTDNSFTGVAIPNYDLDRDQRRTTLVKPIGETIPMTMIMYRPVISSITVQDASGWPSTGKVRVNPSQPQRYEDFDYVQITVSDEGYELHLITPKIPYYIHEASKYWTSEVRLISSISNPTWYTGQRVYPYLPSMLIPLSKKAEKNEATQSTVGFSEALSVDMQSLPQKGAFYINGESFFYDGVSFVTQSVSFSDTTQPVIIDGGFVEFDVSVQPLAWTTATLELSSGLELPVNLRVISDSKTQVILDYDTAPTGNLTITDCVNDNLNGVVATYTTATPAYKCTPSISANNVSVKLLNDDDAATFFANATMTVTNSSILITLTAVKFTESKDFMVRHNDANGTAFSYLPDPVSPFQLSCILSVNGGIATLSTEDMDAFEDGEYVITGDNIDAFTIVLQSSETGSTITQWDFDASSQTTNPDASITSEVVTIMSTATIRLTSVIEGNHTISGTDTIHVTIDADGVCYSTEELPASITISGTTFTTGDSTELIMVEFDAEVRDTVEERVILTKTGDDVGMATNASLEIVGQKAKLFIDAGTGLVSSDSNVEIRDNAGQTIHDVIVNLSGLSAGTTASLTIKDGKGTLTGGSFKGSHRITGYAQDDALNDEAIVIDDDNTFGAALFEDTYEQIKIFLTGGTPPAEANGTAIVSAGTAQIWPDQSVVIDKDQLGIYDVQYIERDQSGTIVSATGFTHSAMFSNVTRAIGGTMGSAHGTDDVITVDHIRMKIDERQVYDNFGISIGMKTGISSLCQKNDNLPPVASGFVTGFAGLILTITTAVQFVDAGYISLRRGSEAWERTFEYTERTNRTMTLRGECVSVKSDADASLQIEVDSVSGLKIGQTLRYHDTKWTIESVNGTTLTLNKTATLNKGTLLTVVGVILDNDRPQIGDQINARFPEYVKFTKQYVGDSNAPLTFDGQYLKCNITGEIGDELMVHTAAPGYSKMHTLETQTVSGAIHTLKNLSDSSTNLIATGNIFSESEAHMLDMYGSQNNDGFILYTGVSCAFTVTITSSSTTSIRVLSTALFPDAGTVRVFSNDGSYDKEFTYVRRTHKRLILENKLEAGFALPVAGCRVEMAGYHEDISVCSAKTRVVKVDKDNDTINVRSTSAFPPSGTIMIDNQIIYDYSRAQSNTYYREVPVFVIQINGNEVIIQEALNINIGMELEGNPIVKMEGVTLTFENDVDSSLTNEQVIKGNTSRVVRNGASERGRLCTTIWKNGTPEYIELWLDTGRNFPEKGYIAVNEQSMREVEYMYYGRREGNKLFDIKRGLDFNYNTGEINFPLRSSTVNHRFHKAIFPSFWSSVTVVRDAFETVESFVLSNPAFKSYIPSEGDNVEMVNADTEAILKSVTKTSEGAIESLEIHLVHGSFPKRGTIRVPFSGQDGDQYVEEMRYRGTRVSGSVLTLSGITRHVNNSIPCSDFATAVLNVTNFNRDLGHFSMVGSLEEDNYLVAYTFKDGRTLSREVFISKQENAISWYDDLMANDTNTVNKISLGMRVTLSCTGLHGYLNNYTGDETLGMATTLRAEDAVESVNIGCAEGWPPFGFFRIDEEDFEYLYRNTDSLLNVTRAKNGTERQDHESGAMVRFMGTLMSFDGYEEPVHTRVNITEHTPTVATISSGVPIRFVNSAIESYSGNYFGKILTVSSTVGFPNTGHISFKDVTYAYTKGEGTKMLKLHANFTTSFTRGDMVVFDPNGGNLISVITELDYTNNLVAGDKVTMYDVKRWRIRSQGVFEGVVERVHGKRGMEIMLDDPFDGDDVNNIFKMWAERWTKARMYAKTTDTATKETKDNVEYEVKTTYVEAPRGETTHFDEKFVLGLLPKTGLSSRADALVAQSNPNDLFIAGKADIAAGKHTFLRQQPAAFSKEGASFSGNGVTARRPNSLPQEGFYFMRPFLPKIAGNKTQRIWGAVMIPATPCKVTILHTEGPSSQRASKLEWNKDPEETFKGYHYFIREVKVTLEVPHGLVRGGSVSQKVKFMDWNPGDQPVRNLSMDTVANADPGWPLQDGLNKDGTYDLRASKTTAWSNMLSLTNDANRFEKQEDWFEQMFGGGFPGVTNKNQSNTRDVDLKGIGYRVPGPWKFNFDVDRALGMEWLHGEMEVVDVIDEFSFVVKLKAGSSETVGNAWRQRGRVNPFSSGGNDPNSERKVKFLDSEEDLKEDEDDAAQNGNVIQPFEEHEFDIFVDLTNGECVNKYSNGDLIYVSGSRNVDGDIVQHRSGVKHVGFVSDDASSWIGDGNWTGKGDRGCPPAKAIGILDGSWITPGDSEYDRPGSEVYNRSRYEFVELFRHFNLVQRGGSAHTVRGRFAGVVAWQTMNEHDMTFTEKDINIDHTNINGAQITPFVQQEMFMTDNPGDMAIVYDKVYDADVTRLEMQGYELENDDVIDSINNGDGARQDLIESGKAEALKKVKKTLKKKVMKRFYKTINRRVALKISKKLSQHIMNPSKIPKWGKMFFSQQSLAEVQIDALKKRRQTMVNEQKRLMNASKKDKVVRKMSKVGRRRTTAIIRKGMANRKAGEIHKIDKRIRKIQRNAMKKPSRFNKFKPSAKMLTKGASKALGRVFWVIGVIMEIAALIEQGEAAVKRNQLGNVRYYRNAKLVEFGHVIDFPEVSRGLNGQSEEFRPSQIAVEDEDVEEEGGRLSHVAPKQRKHGKVGRTYLHSTKVDGVSRAYFEKNTLSDLVDYPVEFENEREGSIVVVAQTINKGSKEITLTEANSGVRPGMTVEGDGIAPNSVVQSTDGVKVTLNYECSRTLTDEPLEIGGQLANPNAQIGPRGEIILEADIPLEVQTVRFRCKTDVPTTSKFKFVGFTSSDVGADLKFEFDTAIHFGPEGMLSQSEDSSFSGIRKKKLSIVWNEDTNAVGKGWGRSLTQSWNSTYSTKVINTKIGLGNRSMQWHFVRTKNSCFNEQNGDVNVKEYTVKEFTYNSDGLVKGFILDGGQGAFTRGWKPWRWHLGNPNDVTDLLGIKIYNDPPRWVDNQPRSNISQTIWNDDPFWNIPWKYRAYVAWGEPFYAKDSDTMEWREALAMAPALLPENPLKPGGLNVGIGQYKTDNTPDGYKHYPNYLLQYQYADEAGGDQPHNIDLFAGKGIDPANKYVISLGDGTPNLRVSRNMMWMDVDYVKNNWPAAGMVAASPYTALFRKYNRAGIEFMTYSGIENYSWVSNGAGVALHRAAADTANSFQFAATLIAAAIANGPIKIANALGSNIPLVQPRIDYHDDGWFENRLFNSDNMEFKNIKRNQDFYPARQTYSAFVESEGKAYQSAKDSGDDGKTHTANLLYHSDLFCVAKLFTRGDDSSTVPVAPTDTEIKRLGLFTADYTNDDGWSNYGDLDSSGTQTWKTESFSSGKAWFEPISAIEVDDNSDFEGKVNGDQEGLVAVNFNRDVSFIEKGVRALAFLDGHQPEAEVFFPDDTRNDFVEFFSFQGVDSDALHGESRNRYITGMRRGLAKTGKDDIQLKGSIFTGFTVVSTGFRTGQTHEVSIFWKSEMELCGHIEFDEKNQRRARFQFWKPTGGTARTIRTIHSAPQTLKILPTANKKTIRDGDVVNYRDPDRDVDVPVVAFNCREGDQNQFNFVVESKSATLENIDFYDESSAVVSVSKLTQSDRDVRSLFWLHLPFSNTLTTGSNIQMSTENRLTLETQLLPYEPWFTSAEQIRNVEGGLEDVSIPSYDTVKPTMGVLGDGKTAPTTAYEWTWGGSLLDTAQDNGYLDAVFKVKQLEKAHTVSNYDSSTGVLTFDGNKKVPGRGTFEQGGNSYEYEAEERTIELFPDSKTEFRDFDQSLERGRTYTIENFRKWSIVNVTTNITTSSFGISTGTTLYESMEHIKFIDEGSTSGTLKLMQTLPAGSNSESIDFGDTYTLDVNGKMYRSRPFSHTFSADALVTETIEGAEVHHRPGDAQKMGFMYAYDKQTKQWDYESFLVDVNGTPFRMTHVLQDPTTLTQSAQNARKRRTDYNNNINTYGSSVYFRASGRWLAGYVIGFVYDNNGDPSKVKIANDFFNWIDDTEGDPHVYYEVNVNDVRWTPDILDGGSRFQFMRKNENWRIGKYYWHYGIGDNRKYTGNRWVKSDIDALVAKLRADFPRKFRASNPSPYPSNNGKAARLGYASSFDYPYDYIKYKDINGVERAKEYLHNGAFPCALTFDGAMAKLKSEWNNKQLYDSKTGSYVGTIGFSGSALGLRTSSVVVFSNILNTATNRVYYNETLKLRIVTDANMKDNSESMKIIEGAGTTTTEGPTESSAIFNVGNAIGLPITITDSEERTDINADQWTKGIVNVSEDVMQFRVPFDDGPLYLHSPEVAGGGNTRAGFTQLELTLSNLTDVNLNDPADTFTFTAGGTNEITLDTPIRMTTRIDTGNLIKVFGEGGRLPDNIQIVARRSVGGVVQDAANDTVVVPKDGVIHVDFSENYLTNTLLGAECFVRNKQGFYLHDDTTHGSFAQYMAVSPDPFTTTVGDDGNITGWPYPQGEVDIQSTRYGYTSSGGVLTLQPAPAETLANNTQVFEVLPRDFWMETDAYSRLDILTDDDNAIQTFHMISDLRSVRPVTVATIFSDVYRLIQDHCIITVDETETIPEDVASVTLSGGSLPATNGDRYAQIANNIGTRPGYEDGTLLRIDDHRMIVRVGNGEDVDTLDVTGYTVSGISYVRGIDIQTLVEAETSKGIRIYPDEKIIMGYILDAFLRDDIPIRKRIAAGESDTRPTDSYAGRMKECREYFGDNLVVEVLSDKTIVDLWL